jgi:hypothetical protein
MNPVRAARQHRLPDGTGRELLDRTLIWNQRHLMTVLREYEDFYNTHRPRRSARCRMASPTWTLSASSSATAPEA